MRGLRHICSDDSPLGVYLIGIRNKVGLPLLLAPIKQIGGKETVDRWTGLFTGLGSWWSTCDSLRFRWMDGWAVELVIICSSSLFNFAFVGFLFSLLFVIYYTSCGFYLSFFYFYFPIYMCLVTSDDVPQNSVRHAAKKNKNKTKKSRNYSKPKTGGKNIHFVMCFVVMIEADDAASESSLYLIIIIKTLMMMEAETKKTEKRVRCLDKK